MIEVLSAMWSSDDGESTVIVGYVHTDGFNQQYPPRLTDSSGRNIYRYMIQNMDGKIHEATDVVSGVGDPIDAMKMLCTLASFVGAWTESVEYTSRNGRPSDNIDLFPMSLYDWAVKYGDEFVNDMFMFENTDDDSDVTS